MAFSTFLRNTGCFSQLLSKSALRPSLQQAASLHKACMSLPLNQSIFSKTETNTPLLNAVRTIRTTAVVHSTDHSKLWVAEKAVSVVLIGVIPAALLMPCKILDSVLAILVVAHIFWGFEAIAVDYVRAILFGPLVPKLAIGAVYAMCIITLGGLFYLIQHDIGIGNTIKKFWSIKPAQELNYVHP